MKGDKRGLVVQFPPSLKVLRSNVNFKRVGIFVVRSGGNARLCIEGCRRRKYAGCEAQLFFWAMRAS